MSEQKLVLWVTRLQSLAFTGKCRDFFHPVCTDWSPDCCMHSECTVNDPVRGEEAICHKKHSFSRGYLIHMPLRHNHDLIAKSAVFQSVVPES